MFLFLVNFLDFVVVFVLCYFQQSFFFMVYSYNVFEKLIF